MEISSLFFPIFFLLGATCLTAIMRSMQIIGRMESKKYLLKRRHFFFYFFFLKKFFPKDEWDNYFFVLSMSKHILRILYTSTGFLFLISFPLASKIFIEKQHPIYTFSVLLLTVLILVGVALLTEFFVRIVVHLSPKTLLKISTPIASFFLVVFSPLTLSLLKIQKSFAPYRRIKNEPINTQKVKDKLLEFVHESEISKILDPMDQRLITSIASFRERIAKEIMVPRIDLFCLPASSTLRQVAKEIAKEGYSRVPVYKDHVDNMIGVLLYKDVMQYYQEAIETGDSSLLDKPLDQMLHPLLFSPETKKISKLLQDFRSKQSHMAIVVDEYGGTEGIVTIEDILEELVGEIADEYDFDEESLFKKHTAGGWIVDSRMNILDIQKELAISIPLSPEYDTIGGFIYHKAGTIPKKGWRLHNDYFNIEVLTSTERTIDKVWIMSPKEDEE